MLRIIQDRLRLSKINERKSKIVRDTTLIARDIQSLEYLKLSEDRQLILMGYRRMSRCLFRLARRVKKYSDFARTEDHDFMKFIDDLYSRVIHDTYQFFANPGRRIPTYLYNRLNDARDTQGHFILEREKLKNLSEKEPFDRLIELADKIYISHAQVKNLLLGIPKNNFEADAKLVASFKKQLAYCRSKNLIPDCKLLGGSLSGSKQNDYILLVESLVLSDRESKSYTHDYFSGIARSSQVLSPFSSDLSLELESPSTQSTTLTSPVLDRVLSESDSDSPIPSAKSDVMDSAQSSPASQSKSLSIDILVKPGGLGTFCQTKESDSPSSVVDASQKDESEFENENRYVL